MDNRPLKSIPESDLKEELLRRKDDEERAYEEWLMQTRPKRARFIKRFNFTQPFPILMFLGPLILAFVIGILFPELAHGTTIIGMACAAILFLFCAVGSFIEAFCERTFYKMRSGELNPQPPNK